MSWAQRFTRSSSGSRVLKRGFWLMMLTAGALSTGGCKAPAKTTPAQVVTSPAIDPLPKRVARTHAYVLADFERPGHETGFRSSDETQPVISSVATAGIDGNALSVSLAPNGELILDLTHDELPRPTDWRGIPTLAFNLLGSAEGGRVRVRIVSGPQPHLEWQQTFAIVPGWHACRVNLEAAAEHVDLSDVQSVVWQWLGDQAAEFALDDLELREDTAWLEMSRSAANTDALNVFWRGSHIHVGVTRVFELVFSRGLIVGWYDRPRILGGVNRLSASWHIDSGPLPPYQPSHPRINLSHFIGLGPHPTPLPENWPSAEEPPPSFDNPRLFAAWGSSVMTRQKVLEATPQRVVIEAVWRFAAEGGPDTPTGEHRWLYTIYPSGDVFVSVRSDGPAWPMPRVGYAVTLAGRMGFEPVGVGPREAQPQAVHFERPIGASDLLWVPHDAVDGRPLQKLSSSRDRWLAALTASADGELPIERAHWLHFGACDAKTARDWAAAYQTPPSLELSVGERFLTADGDLDRDGFNESAGTYEVRPIDNRLRFTYYEAYPPAGTQVRIHGSAGRSVQAYQNGRRIEHIVRDRSGSAIVALKPHQGQSSRVEIFLATMP